LLQIIIMKVFTTVLILIAVGLIIFNLTLLDFEKPFEGNSLVALIGIVASFCAVFILLIFRMSKKIEDQLKKQ
jgi:hypothetical protein